MFERGFGGPKRVVPWDPRQNESQNAWQSGACPTEFIVVYKILTTAAPRQATARHLPAINLYVRNTEANDKRFGVEGLKEENIWGI